MTIEEKAKKLQEYCHKHDWCENCVLDGCSYRCGMGASWLNRKKNRKNLISDDDVEEAYNIVFGKEDENMFNAFVDTRIRKEFSIKLKNKADIEKLLNYLKINNIKCIWIGRGDTLNTYTILERIRAIGFKPIYLYFEYNCFTGNFVVSCSDVLIDTKYNYTVDDIIGGREMFTKKDLKDGMVVKTREGNYYLVCGDLFIRDIGYLEINTYNNDLTSKLFIEKDIVAVYDKIYSLSALNDIKYNKKVLWEREEVKEMTVAEIEKELGYSIKIVKEEEK